MARPSREQVLVCLLVSSCSCRPKPGLLVLRPPPPDCSALQRKRKERGELPRGSRVLSLAEAEQGLGTLVFRACFILLDWAGIPPLARSPSIPQRLAMDRLRAGN